MAPSPESLQCVSHHFCPGYLYLTVSPARLLKHSGQGHLVPFWKKCLVDSGIWKMPVWLAVRIMKQKEVIVVLLDCFLIKIKKPPVAKIFEWKGVWRHSLPKKQPEAHTSSCSRNILKEPNFVTSLWLWNIFAQPKHRTMKQIRAHGNWCSKICLYPCEQKLPWVGSSF